MDPKHIDKTLLELSFHLYQRPLHPELFTIYESRHFFQSGYEVMIWMTGCSHVVGIFSDSHCLIELISPPGRLLPSGGLIESFTLTRQKNYRCSWANPMGYMLNSQLEHMSPNLYKHTHHELTKSADRQGLLIEYPQWSKGDITSFSYLDYETSESEVQLHAYHAFPEHQAILKTQSLFQLNA